MANDVVKIDSELKKRAEALVSKKKFDYPSLKNFIDKAVLKMLEEDRKTGKGGKKAGK